MDLQLVISGNVSKSLIDHIERSIENDNDIKIVYNQTLLGREALSVGPGEIMAWIAAAAAALKLIKTIHEWAQGREAVTLVAENKNTGIKIKISKNMSFKEIDELVNKLTGE